MAPSDHPYLRLALLGKNNWWRYALSFLVIFIIWFGSSLILALALALAAILGGNPDPSFDPSTGQVAGVDPLTYFVITMLSAAALFIGVLLVVRLIHARPVKTVITPRPRLSWKRMAVGFIFFGLLALAASLVEALLFPGRYALTWNPAEFFRFLPFILLLIPIQTAGEELLFRGFLMQSTGLLTRKVWIPLIVTSLIFMSLHLANPEVGADRLLLPLYYLSVGLLFGLVTLRDGRLELALGAHAANNLFAALVANYRVSVLKTPSIFTVDILDPVYGLASFLMIAVIFYLGLFFRPRSSGEEPASPVWQGDSPDESL
jgi:membrane protease YdiL (CAAX protease family)